MLTPGDLRLILHQLANLLQPVSYHVERMNELKTDEPIFNSAMQTLPGRMGALNRVLDRLRILSKPLEPQRARVDLSALVKSVANDVVAMNEYRSVDAAFELPAQCAVEADEYFLHLAFRELLLNAAEAAVQSTSPEIRVRLRSDVAGCRVEIEDSGFGIPENAMRFTLFQSSRAGSGAGLGLPLARHIVEAHGGAISFGGSLDVRSRVTVVLPHAEA